MDIKELLKSIDQAIEDLDVFLGEAIVLERRAKAEVLYDPELYKLIVKDAYRLKKFEELKQKHLGVMK